MPMPVPVPHAPLCLCLTSLCLCLCLCLTHPCACASHTPVCACPVHVAGKLITLFSAPDYPQFQEEGGDGEGGRYNNMGAVAVLSAPDYATPVYKTYEAVLPRPTVDAYYDYHSFVCSDEDLLGSEGSGGASEMEGDVSSCMSADPDPDPYPYLAPPACSSYHAAEHEVRVQAEHQIRIQILIQAQPAGGPSGCPASQDLLRILIQVMHGGHAGPDLCAAAQQVHAGGATCMQARVQAVAGALSPLDGTSGEPCGEHHPRARSGEVAVAAGAAGAGEVAVAGAAACAGEGCGQGGGGSSRGGGASTSDVGVGRGGGASTADVGVGRGGGASTADVGVGRGGGASIADVGVGRGGGASTADVGVGRNGNGYVPGAGAGPGVGRQASKRRRGSGLHLPLIPSPGLHLPHTSSPGPDGHLAAGVGKTPDTEQPHASPDICAQGFASGSGT